MRRKLAARALLAVPLVLALGVSAAGGGLSIPHNDAWAYGKIAERFASDGTVSLVGWNRPGLVGQTLLAVPLTRLLPDATVAQHLTVWALALLLVLAAERFFRPVLGMAGAAVVAGVTVLFPGLGLLATSFMADVPAAALGMLCLLAGARAAAALPRPAGWGWLALSLVLGWLAATTREQALAAPAAVVLWLGLALFRQRRSGELAGVLGAAGLFLAAFVAAELWRRGLANADAPIVASASWRSPAALVRGAVTLGLALLPVSLLIAPGLVAPGLTGRLGPRALAALAAAAAALTFLLVRVVAGAEEALLSGNYLGGPVPYPEAGLGAPPALLPEALWVVAALAGAWSLLVIVAALTRERDGPAPRHPRLGLGRTFALLTVAGTTLQTLAGQLLFDRYLLPLVPVVAGMCLAEGLHAGRPVAKLRAGWPGRRAALVAPAIAAGLLAVLGGVLVTSGTAHDVARWRAAERLVREGAAARDVAAGLEWVGWHSQEPFRPGAVGPARTAWSVHFSDSRDCWVVAGDRRDAPDLVLERTLSYDRLLVTAPAQMHVYRSDRC